jgi:hypothetical protein
MSVRTAELRLNGNVVGYYCVPLSVDHMRPGEEVRWWLTGERPPIRAIFERTAAGEAALAFASIDDLLKARSASQQLAERGNPSVFEFIH